MNTLKTLMVMFFFLVASFGLQAGAMTFIRHEDHQTEKHHTQRNTFQNPFTDPERAAEYSFKVADEAYINDIPFDTEKVVEKLNVIKMDENLHKMTEESEIMDIPFDTKAIFDSIVKP
ncbi:hypothetical protein MASR2M12_17400 [Bacteroidales bacterium]